MIHDDATTFGLFGTVCPPSPRQTLNVIRSLANRVMNYASINGALAVKPTDLIDGDDGGLFADSFQGRSALNDRAPFRARETAVAVAAALEILRAPCLDEAGRRARWLIQDQNADTGPAELRSCARDAPLATAVIVRASEERLGPELQLRYRAAVTVPCTPDLDMRSVERIAAGLPSVMWPAWSTRLLPDLRRTAMVRATLSCATLLAGSALRPATAASLLGENVSPNAMNHRLWVLRESRFWLQICAGLIRLSDYLHDEPAPIDYSRRRGLDYSALLSAQDWAQACGTFGLRLGSDSMTPAAAKAYLTARLTGGATSWTNNPPIERGSDFDESPTRVGEGGGLRLYLDEVAKSFLARADVDEPLVWHAPLDLLSDLGLPMLVGELGDP